MTSVIPEGGPMRYRVELRDGRLVLKTPDLLFAEACHLRNPQLRIFDCWEEEYIDGEWDK